MNNKIETCTLCGSTDYATIYNGKIRDGSFGKVSKQEHEVVRWKKCGLVRLYIYLLIKIFMKLMNIASHIMILIMYQIILICMIMNAIA